MREYKNDIAGSLAEVEEDVVTRSACRDLAAFEQLVRKYQPYAFSLAMKFLCDEAEASDVVQDSFLRVWKNIDRYDPKQKLSGLSHVSFRENNGWSSHCETFRI